MNLVVVVCEVQMGAVEHLHAGVTKDLVVIHAPGGVMRPATQLTHQDPPWLVHVGFIIERRPAHAQHNVDRALGLALLLVDRACSK